MKRTTQQLMTSLVADLRPVQRLRPPWQRAFGWIGTVTLVFAGLVVGVENWRHVADRLQRIDVDVECLSAVMTGVLSVLAAFYLSVPGRGGRWALVPVVSSAVWLVCSGTLGFQHWIAAGEPAESVFGSLRCFAFIAGSSVPLTASLFWLLRRSHPLAPAPLGAAAAVGGAGFAGFLLQFFHAVAPGPIDLSAHVAAVSLVVAFGALLGKRTLAA